MIDALAASPIVRAVGWAILQSLWQGTLVGILTAAALFLLRQRNPRARSAVAWAGLLVIVTAFVFTAVGSMRNRTSTAGPLSGAAITLASTAPAPTTAGRPGAFDHTVIDGNTYRWSRERLQTWSVALVPLWIVGMVVLSIRLLAGWVLIGRLRRASTQPLDDAWQARVEAIVARLRIRRAVAVVESTVVKVPTMIGWLRPVVLLPASVFAGLSVEQLEAIIAHELAHVRRHDYVANVLQSVIEVVLFYHPVCWWISRQIRTEREHCCDDVAAEQCGSRLTYARALASLETLRGSDAALGLAATDGPLMRRVRRLLGTSAAREHASASWIVSGLIAAGVALVITAASAGAAMRGASMAQAGAAGGSRVIPANQGVLQGQIVDAQSGRPVGGAAVSIYSNPRGVAGPDRAGNVYAQIADADGRYEIGGVVPGEYFVSATTAGYVLTYFGRANPFGTGTPVSIVGGRVRPGIDIRMTRGATIGGRVFADAGEGLSGVEIEVIEAIEGAVPPSPTAFGLVEGRRAAGFAQTEEGGVYRVANLPPGDYYVRAYAPGTIRPERGTRAEAYSSTFFPDATEIGGAQPIRVAVGQEAFNIDFTLATVATRTVRGRLVDPGGPPLDKATVVLWSRDHGPDERLHGDADKNGRFTIDGVIPDNYLVTVRDPADQQRWIGASRSLIVDDDVSGLEIEAMRTARIAGRVLRGNGQPLPFDASTLNIIAQYVLNGMGQMRGGIGPHSPGVERDGSFVIESPAGSTVLNVSGLPEGWTVRSARLDGVDVSDREFELSPGANHRIEIVVTDRLSGVNGTVTDRANRPMSTATVVVFPEDPTRRRAERLTRAVAADEAGVYRIEDLPAGDYLLVAVDSLAPNAWRTPATLDRLASIASRLRIEEGERVGKSLKIADAN